MRTTSKQPSRPRRSSFNCNLFTQARLGGLFVCYDEGMFGIILAAVASGLAELSESIGKYEVRKRAESYYTLGVLSLLSSVIFFAAISIYKQSFVFSLASLPTFLPRLCLEIFQAHISIKALVKSDRGDFGLIRSVTVPLLLFVDLALGYVIFPLQIMGMALIFAAIIILLYFEHFHTKARWLLFASAINAVATISLYKYNITHFNAVETEQGIVTVVLLLYFILLAVFVAKENPFSFLARPVFVLQSASMGLASISGAYALLFAPASVITAALRAFSVLFSVISGRFYFHERQFALKATLFVLVAIGIALLTV